MSRIEANVATQIADVVRPEQNAQESRRQVEQDRIEAAKHPEKQEVSSEDITAVAEQLKKVVEVASGKNLRFDIYEESKQFFVTIRDQETDEVIKQLPSEEILELQQRMEKIVGSMVDQEA